MEETKLHTNELLGHLFEKEQAPRDLTGIACQIFEVATGAKHHEVHWYSAEEIHQGNAEIPENVATTATQALEEEKPKQFQTEQPECVVIFPLKETCFVLRCYPPEDNEWTTLIPHERISRTHQILDEIYALDLEYSQRLQTARKSATRAEQQSRRSHLLEQKNEEILAENLEKNEQLLKVNETLEEKVRQRTQELEESMETVTRQKEEITRLSQFKDELTRMLVHDLKTPVGIVMNVLEGLKEQVFDPVEDSSIVENSLQSAINMRDLINTMLDMTKLRSGKLELYWREVDLPELVESVSQGVELLARDKELQLKKHIPETCQVVKADHSLLQRTLNNLLTNAIKYADSTADIDLRVTPTKDAASVCFSVSNAGPNIPGESHDKIFDMFTQAKKGNEPGKEGSGIGLTFCKLAVEAHGGTIWVESPLPDGRNGAMFCFSIPQTPPTDNESEDNR